MSIYQSATGQWIYFDGHEKHVFDTEGEARQMSSEQTFITRVRALNRTIWNSVIELHGLQTEWDKRQFGTTLDDGEGENAGVTAVQVGAVVFDSADALMAVLTSGIGGNMAALL